MYKMAIRIADLKAAATTVLYKETIPQGHAGYKVVAAKLIQDAAATSGAKVAVNKVSKSIATGAAETTALAEPDATAKTAAWDYVAVKAQPSATVNNTIGYREKYTAKNGTAVAAFAEALEVKMTTAAVAGGAVGGWLILTLE